MGETLIPVRLSVVIACYNAEETIGQQLEALAGQVWTDSWEVIVVNNRCTDGSMQVVERYRERMPRLRAVDAVERQGAAYAMNVGARAASAQWLAFCDADDVVAPGWIAGLAKALSTHAFVSGPQEFERLNAPAVTKPFGNGQATGIQEYTDPPYLPHCGAGNIGITRKVFDSVGGFDETMAACFDTDFCWRVQLAGVSLRPAPDALLHVRRRHTMRGILAQARLWGQWNVFLYKRYRTRGMPNVAWREGLRGWLHLIRRIRVAFDPEYRALWVWQMGWRVGRLIGSIKYRVLAF